jgi:hypothetical protein
LDEDGVGVSERGDEKGRKEKRMWMGECGKTESEKEWTEGGRWEESGSVESLGFERRRE